MLSRRGGRNRDFVVADPCESVTGHKSQVTVQQSPSQCLPPRQRRSSLLSNCESLRQIFRYVCSPINKPFTLIWLQPPGVMNSAIDTSEHAATANQLLNTARLLCEKVAAESAEANQKLSAAILDIVLYTERMESSSRLLALADSCVGQIRSRMRAHGIPILPPSMPSDAITAPNVNGPSIQSAFFLCSHAFVLTNRQTAHPKFYIHARWHSCNPHVCVRRI